MLTHSPRVYLQNGTEVRLADGTSKAVEHLTHDDRLLGPDGKPRKVMCIRRRPEYLCMSRLHVPLSEIEVPMLTSLGPVPLRPKSRKKNSSSSNAVFDFDHAEVVRRVEGVVGQLPPPDLEPTSGKPRTTTIRCGTFLVAIRRAFATLLNISRQGSAKVKFEHAANEESGIFFARKTYTVKHPAPRRGVYESFTWDPAFSGGHSLHPPQFFPNELEARSAARRCAKGLVEAQGISLFNLRGRLKDALHAGRFNCRVDARFLNIRLLWTKESLARGEYYVEVCDNQKKPGWKYKYAFRGLPPTLTGSLSPPPPTDRFGDSLSIFEIEDIADDSKKKVMEGVDDGLGAWRLERLTNDIGFDNENPLPLDALIVGYVLGDVDIDILDPVDLAKYLRIKLSPLINPDHETYVLDRDHAQDAFPETRPTDVDQHGEPIQFAYLSTRSEDDDVAEDGVGGRLTVEDLLPVEDIETAFGFTVDGLWASMAKLGIVGEERRVPTTYLTSSRSDRLRLLAGFVESCHTTVARGRFRLHRSRWDDSLAKDVRSLVLSLGMDIQHYQLGWNGYYDVHDTIDFLEISGDITTVPCRLAHLVDPCPPRLHSLVHLQDVVPQFRLRRIECTSFRLDKDGLFLREDYLILGGSKIQPWPPGDPGSDDEGAG